MTTPRSVLTELNAEYSRMVREHWKAGREASLAKAEHVKKRAQKILRLKDANPEMSHAEAATRAEADDEIADLHQKRLIAESNRSSLRQKLEQLKEDVQSARADVRHERNEDEFHARGYGGAP